MVPTTGTQFLDPWAHHKGVGHDDDEPWPHVNDNQPTDEGYCLHQNLGEERGNS